MKQLRVLASDGRIPSIMLLQAELTEALQANATDASAYLKCFLEVANKGNALICEIFGRSCRSSFRHGYKDATIALLERGVQVKAFPYDFLMLNPDLKSLQFDSRYQKILSQFRGQFGETMAVIQSSQKRGEFPQYLEKPLADLLKKLNYQQ